MAITVVINDGNGILPISMVITVIGKLTVYLYLVKRPVLGHQLWHGNCVVITIDFAPSYFGPILAKCPVLK